MAKVGDVIQIHSFKHDKSYHRIWYKTLIVEMNDEFVVLVNERTRVLKSDGSSWFTQEPAVCFFFSNSWYNIICMLKNNGVSYYCNLGTPYVLDDEAIKYIDYDLDIKVYPSLQYRVLDKFEYQVNADEMNYSDEIREIISYEFENLKKRIQNKENPFNEDYVKFYYDKYKKMMRGD